MKATLLNGAKASDRLSEAAHQALVAGLQKAGYEVSQFIIRDLDLAYCAGCFGCWIKTPGNCLVDDDGKQIVISSLASDLLVVLTPVVFGGYSPLAKKAIERMMPEISPFFRKINGEVHHKPRYKHYPSVLAVGVLAKPDEESERLFRQLVERNAINFNCPSHATGVVGTGGQERIASETAALLERMRGAI